MKSFFKLASLSLVLFCVGCDAIPTFGLGGGDNEAPLEQTGPVLSLLVIDTALGPRQFRVEIADTEEKRQQGLMYRREMAEDLGMLFNFEETRPVSMWMKNTYLPLDMLFIRSDGSIARIVENTTPRSVVPIPSGEPVLAVLELNGGTVASLGIMPSDRIRHSLFGTAVVEEE